MIKIAAICLGLLLIEAGSSDYSAEFTPLTVNATQAKSAETMFLGNPAHSGGGSEEVPQSFHRVKWTFPTGGRIFSSPVTSNGLIYFGSDDGNLYAVNALTGKQVWKTSTQGPVDSTPAISGGNLYATSYDGRMYCLDAATGDPKWEFLTEGERRFEAKGLHGMSPHTQTIADLFDTYLSSPVVVDGVVYFGSGDTHIYALNAITGELKWKFKTGDVVHASPAVSGGTVYVGSWDSYFYAVDAKTGKLKWRFQGGVDLRVHNQVGFQSSPSVYDNVVYTGCRDSNVYALSALTGKEIWRCNNSGSWVNSSPVKVGNKILFGTADSQLFRAVSAETGKGLYSQPCKAYMFSSPTVAGNIILIGTLAGTLDARDISNGSLLWSYRTQASSYNSFWALTARGEMNPAMLFNSRFTAPMAVDKQLGAGCVLSTPLVEGGVVYFGSTDGYLYAVE